MTYAEWVRWLETRNPMPQVRPGLDKTRNAIKGAGLFELIDPRKVIHVAGTNGKGTTSKTLEQLLLSAQQSVSLFTSPHLIETTERLRADGQDISPSEFVELCETYAPLITKYDLSHFEALTLFAVAWFFKIKKTTWAIFEIGLGGTWDATNVIPHSTSVITSLGFDHTHTLGSTLEEIAANKFGIIWPSNQVIHLPLSNALQRQLDAVLRKQAANSQCAPEPQVEATPGQPLPQYTLKSPWGEAPLSLPGRRAASNMVLALCVFEALGFNPQAHLQTLSQIRWPARMSRLPRETICPVYLSGDHNIQGLESLMEILNAAQWNHLHLIIGVSKNRSPTEFVDLVESLPRSTVTLTRPRFQGVTPEKLNYPFFEDPETALAHVLRGATPNDLVVVTGSLYLCADYFTEHSPPLDNIDVVELRTSTKESSLSIAIFGY